VAVTGRVADLLWALVLTVGLDGTVRADGPLVQWSDVEEPARGPDLEEPLATDRPDFTETSSTVGRGVLQIESGYTFIHDDDDGVRTDTHSFGELLFRYGLLYDWLELRLTVAPLLERTEVQGRTETNGGVDDLSLGVKLWLSAQYEWRPEMAIIGSLRVPTGSAAFTADEPQPGVNWLVAWDVDDRIATGGSTGAYRATDDGDDCLLTTHSWTASYSFTEALGSYVEWFALVPHSSRTASTEHYFDGGPTYLLSKDVQLDLRAGVGLNDAADDVFTGIGLSVRLP
jgi:hypothetical protein